MTTTQDFYTILGVSRRFSPAELKKNYRRLAKQHHPDRNPGNRLAEETFKQLSNAYHVLSDPVRRMEYDRFLQNRASAREAGSHSEEDFVFDFPEPPVFDDLAEWRLNAFLVLGLILYVICVLYSGLVAKIPLKAYYAIMFGAAVFGVLFGREVKEFIASLTLKKLNLLTLVILAIIFTLHARPLSYYSVLKLPVFVGWLAWESKWSVSLLVAFGLTVLLFFRKRAHALVLLFILQILLMTLVRFDHNSMAGFNKYMRQQFNVQKADMEEEEEPVPAKKEGGKSSVGGK